VGSERRKTSGKKTFTAREQKKGGMERAKAWVVKQKEKESKQSA